MRHRRWACRSFSVDIGAYSFPTRVIGTFPHDRLCIGYMRSLTAPTWVNGFEFGMDAIQFYPAGCEMNYRAGSNGEWERCLQMHFLDAYGMTPGRWARCLALHRVRDRLLKTDPARFTVEGVARECGFRHMGRFASYYEELFDEFPSATLTKAAFSRGFAITSQLPVTLQFRMVKINPFPSLMAVFEPKSGGRGSSYY